MHSCCKVALRVLICFQNLPHYPSSTSVTILSFYPCVQFSRYLHAFSPDLHNGTCVQNSMDYQHVRLRPTTTNLLSPFLCRWHQGDCFAEDSHVCGCSKVSCEPRTSCRRGAGRILYCHAWLTSPKLKGLISSQSQRTLNFIFSDPTDVD